MAIRVVEGHSGRASGQQRLLQRGGGDVVGVEQAGAMARGSEGHICRARKRPRSKACVRGSGRRVPSRLRHLPTAGPGRSWSTRRGRRGSRGPRSNVAMTAGASLLPREDARGRADASNFPGDGTPERSNQMTSIPLALSRAFWCEGGGEGNRSTGRRGPYR